MIKECKPVSLQWYSSENVLSLRPTPRSAELVDSVNPSVSFSLGPQPQNHFGWPVITLRCQVEIFI